MQALLIISHGSRRQESNDEVTQLAEHVRSIGSDKFNIIVHAYLELVQPSIPAGIKKCIDQGATHILVLPYFLAAGRHVAEHIPEIITNATIDYPKVVVTIAPHVGSSPLMAEFMYKSALNSLL